MLNRPPEYLPRIFPHNLRGPSGRPSRREVWPPGGLSRGKFHEFAPAALRRPRSRLPMPIVMAMVTGVFLQFGLNLIFAIRDDAMIAVPMAAMFLLLSIAARLGRIVPPVIGALIVGALAIARISGRTGRNPRPHFAIHSARHADASERQNRSASGRPLAQRQPRFQQGRPGARPRAGMAAPLEPCQAMRRPDGLASLPPKRRLFRSQTSYTWKYQPDFQSLE